MKRTISIVGLIITIGYLSLIWLLTSDRLGQLLTMPLNELGDFLAGAFGPVAILWLILGFLQQGQELRQSTEALKLQAQELNHSVQQQQALVKVSRQQLKSGREAVLYERDRIALQAEPKFIFSGINGVLRGNQGEFVCNVKNIRGTAIHISIQTDPNIRLKPAKIADWETNQERELRWTLDRYEPHKTVNLKLRYTNTVGDSGEAHFTVSIKTTAELPKVKIQEQIRPTLPSK